MIVYLDSSCAVSLVKDEPTTDAVQSYVDDLLDDGHLIVSGQICETEVRRVAVRFGIDAGRATDVLEAIEVIEHDPIDFTRAGSIAMRDLGSLDALHVATAQRANAMAMLTFDARLAAASEAVGIPVLDVTRPRTSH